MAGIDGSGLNGPLYNRAVDEDDVWQRLGIDRSDLESRIAWYTVPLFGEAAQGKLRPCGVGTLVAFEGGAYILSASHVWTEGLRDAKYIRLAISQGPHRFGWRVDVTPEPVCLRSAPYGRKGPDLCLIRIPDPSFVGEILAAQKVIYNLDNRAEPPEEKESGLFVIAGAPAYLQSSAGETLDGGLEISVVPNPTLSRGDAFDLYTFDIYRKGVESFQGLSGGGVWWVPHGNPSAARLDGVVFWQELTDHLASIVCHGPDSIREMCARVRQLSKAGR